MEIEIPPKTRAKALYDAGSRTANALMRGANISQATAYRYLAEFKEGGTHERKPYKQRAKPKQTSKIQKKVLQKAKERNRIWSTRAIGSYAGVSHTQARIIMVNHGFKYQRYKRQLKLTEENMKLRLKFARERLRKWSDWGYMFFSDECSFWRVNTKPEKLWTNEPLNEQGTGTKGIKINVWGAISARGALSLAIFEHNLKATDLEKIMRARLGQMNRLYPEGFIWQQDVSGVHRSNTVNDFIDKELPQRIDWPGYSPDISPLENVWSWLKGEVSKDCPKTSEAMKRCIRRHWNRIDSEFLAPFINSLPNRMEQLVLNKGGKINY